MESVPNWAQFIISQLIVAAAIWGGIRAEIRALHERVKAASDAANKAHERIDTILHDTGAHPAYREHRGRHD